MTAADRNTLPSIGDIAAEVLDDWGTQLPMRLRPVLVKMATLQVIGDDEAYQVVARVRNSLRDWRSPKARSVKLELDMKLTHYRAERW